MKAVFRFIVVIILSLMIISCSSDSDDGDNNPVNPGGGGNNGEQPEVEVPMFIGPETDAVEADVTRTYVQMFDYFNSFANSMYGMSLDYSEGNGTWSNTWQGEGITYLLTVKQKSDGMFEWNLTMNGSYDGVDYNNYLYYTGTASGDGSSGNWTIYDWEGNSTVDFSYNWSTDNNDVVTATVVYPAGNARYVISEDYNGSGSIQYYEDDILRFTSTWTPNSGSYVTYDENGTEVDSGNWG